MNLPVIIYIQVPKDFFTGGPDGPGGPDAPGDPDVPVLDGQGVPVPDGQGGAVPDGQGGAVCVGSQVLFRAQMVLLHMHWYQPGKIPTL